MKSTPKSLSELIRDAGVVKLIGSPDLTVSGLCYNSMMAKPGFLFVAIAGAKADGHDYIEDALRRGAACIVAEREGAVTACPSAVVVQSSRAALAAIAREFYGDPSDRLKVIGITGTNGKTTVAYMAHHILNAAGWRPGIIGTIEYRVGQRTLPAPNTTPESLDIQAMLAELEEEGGRAMVMEVSSHALDQGRVEGLRFAVGVFTNLSQDHFDYHKTIEAYREAKMKLFDKLTANDRAIVNVDDDVGVELARSVRSCGVTYGIENEAMLEAADLELSLEGSRFGWRHPGGKVAVDLPTIGGHNVSNFLAAAGACMALGIEPEFIARSIAAFPGVPGRLERVDQGQDFLVLVDYAHTDDALEKVLVSLGELKRNRILVVFGCGGDRDRQKRPLMAAVVEKHADFAVVTSDNPRSEDPNAIIEEIRDGFSPSAKYVVEVDRRKAIQRAVSEAGAGDIVLIAGKGHETYQKFADGMVHFDDREETRNALKPKSGSS